MKAVRKLMDLETASSNPLGKMNPYTLIAVFFIIPTFLWMMIGQTDWIQRGSNQQHAHRRDVHGETDCDDCQSEHKPEPDQPADRTERHGPNADTQPNTDPSTSVDNSTPQSADRRLIPYPAEVRKKIEHIAAANRRIHHIRIAIDNLNIARLPEMAEPLRDQIASIESDVKETRRRLAVDLADVQVEQMEQMHQTVRTLQDEVDRLRAEVKRLGEQQVER